MSKRVARPPGDGRQLVGSASSKRTSASARSRAKAGSALASGLRERLPEIEAAITTRVYAISDPHAVADAGYVRSLDLALAAAIAYRLAVLELGARRAPSIPTALLAQARLDARDGVSLDTALRRYFAGNALFGDFLAEEAERTGVPSAAVRRLLGEQATSGDRLLAAVSAEHALEAKSWPSGAVERRRECVKSLLAGELVDQAELGYDLGGHHLALMAKGEGVQKVLSALAATLDRRLLAVCREEEPIWACWLGGRSPLAAAAAMRALRELSPEGMFVTVGEPAVELVGWRFSHRQAKAALPIAELRGQTVLRYADVALIASVLRGDLLVATLRRLYVEPLEAGRDRGKAAKETLRAYFAAERNLTSTAAALGVDRRTVANRIHAIEGLFGRPLREFATEVETALQLDG